MKSIKLDLLTVSREVFKLFLSFFSTVQKLFLTNEDMILELFKEMGSD